LSLSTTVNLRAAIAIRPTAPAMNIILEMYFNVLFFLALFYSLLEPIGSLPPYLFL
jgi:hypothetical protein